MSMDPELRAWTERQNKAMDDLAAGQQRGNDQLLMITRELANIAMMLAPRESEGPSALEELLAQLVAQGQESVGQLRKLVRQGDRIEAKIVGQAVPPAGSMHGNGSATRQ